MKEILDRLATYNLWANKLLMDTVKNLPEALHQKEVPSSFNSLLKTVLHMWNAQSVWWQRTKLQEHIVEPKNSFNGNMQDAIEGLMQQSKQWQEWVHKSKDHHLDHVFAYKN